MFGSVFRPSFRYLRLSGMAAYWMLLHPEDFNEDLLVSAVQVALRRTDVKVRLVKEFPDEAGLCLRFNDSPVVKDSCCRGSGSSCE